jgi:hypothetical protein
MRGFRGFRGVETIPSDTLEEQLKRLNIENRFIYWTGNGYNGRTQSLRSNSLKALKVVKTPVPLKDWIRLAARVVEGTDQGYNPASVRAGLYLHHDSKPAVYFELKLEADGSYTSANNVPYADGYPQGLKAGEVVIPAAAKEEPAQVETKGKEIVQTEASKARTTAKRAGRATGPGAVRAKGKAVIKK